MNETEYKPNSHKYKESQQQLTEERRVEKVVKGVAKTKKKSEIRKFADIFISEDIRNVKSYVFMDVLVPAIKKAISDIVTDGIDMILYGGTGRSGRKTSSSSKISYTRYYDRRDDRRAASNEPRTTSRFDYEDIIFESRPEAAAALEEMGNVIERYGFVTVADLYDMANLTQPYTSNKYGWLNIRTAEIVRAREGGYIIKLPKALPID